MILSTFPVSVCWFSYLHWGGKCGSHRNTKCMYVMVSSSIKQGGWLWRGFLGYCASYVVSVKLCIMVLIIWLFLFLPLPPTVLESSNSTVHLQSPFWLFTLFFLLPNQLSNTVTHSVCVGVCIVCVRESVCVFVYMLRVCMVCVRICLWERERECVCVWFLSVKNQQGTLNNLEKKKIWF